MVTKSSERLEIHWPQSSFLLPWRVFSIRTVNNLQAWRKILVVQVDNVVTWEVAEEVILLTTEWTKEEAPCNLAEEEVSRIMEASTVKVMPKVVKEEECNKTAIINNLNNNKTIRIFQTQFHLLTSRPWSADISKDMVSASTEISAHMLMVTLT